MVDKYGILGENLDCLQQISGEVSGQFLTRVDAGKDAKNPYLIEYHTSLFIEASNILAGHFLNDLEDNFEVMTYLCPPIVMNDQKEPGAKRRKLFQWLDSQHQGHEFIEAKYELSYQGQTYDFYAIPIMTMNKYAGQA